MDGVRFVEGYISAADYLKLREAAGWPELDYDTAVAALANSIYSVNAVNRTEVVGCARVVGDGGLYFYIQDVIVLPEFRGMGVEAGMMDLIMAFIRGAADTGAFVGMMADGRMSGFYVADGFPDGAGLQGRAGFGTWPGSGLE